MQLSEIQKLGQLKVGNVIDSFIENDSLYVAFENMDEYQCVVEDIDIQDVYQTIYPSCTDSIDMNPHSVEIIQYAKTILW